MIYAILFVWLVFGLFLAYCLFYFTATPGERVMIVVIWPFLLGWAVLCLIWLGIETVYKIIARDMTRDEP